MTNFGGFPPLRCRCFNRDLFSVFTFSVAYILAPNRYFSTRYGAPLVFVILIEDNKK